VLSEAEVGFAVFVEAAPDILASSTSPSSTSVGFGVGTPRELKIKVSDNQIFWRELANLARDWGLNSGAVGFKVVFELETLVWDVALDVDPLTCSLAYTLSANEPDNEPCTTYHIVAKCLHHYPCFRSLLKLY